mmetsp:Transcript_34107/g.82037  ORF Transcript_34107/g.82037 Transcript_34107/m.82037 type:complete len:82 (-) Transcript_34107:3073-3318(-)
MQCKRVVLCYLSYVFVYIPAAIIIAIAVERMAEEDTTTARPNVVPKTATAPDGTSPVVQDDSAPSPPEVVFVTSTQSQRYA